MTITLDASAGLEIVLKREKAMHFRELLKSAKTVYSSDLYKVETANVLWKYVRIGLLTKDSAIEILQLALDLVDVYHDIADYNVEALQEAIRQDHSVYDMLYLTLARRTASVLLSMDKRLIVLAKQQGLQTN
jgi:predicted nucleic acid-binding protein